MSVQIHAPLRVPPAPRIGAGRVLVRSFSQRFILYVPARTLALWYLYCCSLPYFTITSAYILRLLLRTFCFRTLVSLFRRGFVPIDFPPDCVFLIDCPSDCFDLVFCFVLDYEPTKWRHSTSLIAARSPPPLLWDPPPASPIARTRCLRAVSPHRRPPTLVVHAAPKPHVAQSTRL